MNVHWERVDKILKKLTNMIDLITKDGGGANYELMPVKDPVVWERSEEDEMELKPKKDYWAKDALNEWPMSNREDNNE
jgi:hypothetical protein